MTLHRARTLASDVASIEREGEEHFRLEVRKPFFLSDPRCRLALDERVLSALGHRPASASELAPGLGVTARAVQRVLRRLAEDGVCEGRSEGRGLLYRVIDTTFTEPSFELDPRPRPA